MGAVSDPEFARMFAERLTSALSRSGLGVSDLAHYLQRSRQQVWQWTSGEVVPNLETAAKIAEALGVTTDYLAGLSDEEGKPS